MANLYYSKHNFVPFTKATSTDMNTTEVNTESAFDLLPTPTTSGEQGFKDNFKVTKVPTNKHHIVRVTDIQNSKIEYAEDTSSISNNYVVTLSPAPDIYKNGYTVFFRAGKRNTGIAYLNVNNIGNIEIVRHDGTTLQEGDILEGTIIGVTYRQNKFQLLIDNNIEGICDAPKDDNMYCRKNKEWVVYSPTPALFLDVETTASTPSTINVLIYGSDFTYNGAHYAGSSSYISFAKTPKIQIGIDDLSSLQYFIISYGSQIKGKAPDLSNCDSLTDITIQEAQLYGDLPDTSNCTNLMYYMFDGNDFTGSVSDMSNNPNLVYVYLDSCNLSGTIPDLSNLTNLVALSLYDNNSLTGNIPDLSNTTSLEQLLVNRCNLTGAIPDLSNLTSLKEIRLQDNNLTGDIPDLSNNTVLKLFMCDNNNLTGYAGTLLASSITSFKAGGNALSETAVNNILIQLDAAGSTYNYCELAGGTNHAPTGAGLVAKNNLLAKHWTVNTN